jgi:dTDP-4-amino-4,6-dideoxygalactose transaminase
VTRQPFVDLAARFREVESDLLPEITRTFASGAFIGGEAVRRFESAFAAYCRRAHAVGVANGTDALRLALHAVGVRPGDEVITVPNSFVATAEAIGHCGARPVFVDVVRDDLLMDADALDLARTPRTRAVVPVHLYGRLADVARIGAWCRRYGVALVEDAAQAHGARLAGRPAGSFGDAAAFSFYPAKNLGAAGDAGALVTDRVDVAERARIVRDHGQRERYCHEVEGVNSRLDAVQAVVLDVHLRHLDRWNAQRRARAARYRERLARVDGIELLSAPDDPDSHVYHLFVVRLRGRDAARASLDAERIDTGIHYPIPIHLQPAYRHLGYREGAFPIVEAAAREILSLPMYPQMTDAAVGRVCDALERFVAAAGDR